MKRFFLILLLMLATLTARAQNFVYTGILTITNTCSNGWTFSVNGHLRTITNSVTSANNQILTNLDIPGTTSNIFNAFISYPETSPFLLVLQTSPSNILFQTLASASPALTFATNYPLGTAATASYWVTWSYSTNQLTNEIVVRLPTNGLSNYERTNYENWFVGLLDDPGATNSFSYSAPMFGQFLGTNFGAGITNYVSNLVWTASNMVVAYSSNITVTASNTVLLWSSNYAWNIGTANTNFTLYASNALWTLFDPLLGALAPWQNGNHDVYLTNANNVLRYYAVNNSGTIGGTTEMFESDGSTGIFYSDGQGNKFFYDRNGVPRMQQEDNNVGAYGNSIFDSAAGHGITLGQLRGTLIADTPVVLQTNLWPAVAGGTVTNFVMQSQNADTSVDGLDTLVIPANVLTNNGDTIVRDIGVTCGVNSTSTKQVYVVFGSATVIDSTAQLPTGTGGYIIRCVITRINSSTISFACTGTGINVPTKTFGGVGTSTSGINYGSIMNFLVNVQSTGSGSAADQITIVTDNVLFYPSSVWTVMP